MLIKMINENKHLTLYTDTHKHTMSDRRTIINFFVFDSHSSIKIYAVHSQYTDDCTIYIFQILTQTFTHTHNILMK